MLSEIKDLTDQQAAQLKDAGVTSLANFLELCGSKKGRKQIAEQTSIDEKLILNWLNRADLSRVKGISTQYADLLEHAGVDTVPELAQRNAENLHVKMTELNSDAHLVAKMPSATQVQDWVTQAKQLPRAIHY